MPRAVFLNARVAKAQCMRVSTPALGCAATRLSAVPMMHQTPYFCCLCASGPSKTLDTPHKTPPSPFKNPTQSLQRQTSQKPLRACTKPLSGITKAAQSCRLRTVPSSTSPQLQTPCLNCLCATGPQKSPAHLTQPLRANTKPSSGLTNAAHNCHLPALPPSKSSQQLQDTKSRAWQRALLEHATQAQQLCSSALPDVRAAQQPPASRSMRYGGCCEHAHVPASKLQQLPASAFQQNCQQPESECAAIQTAHH